MKRSWIGFGLLLVLLAMALLVTWAMSRIHEPIAEDLRQAAECAQLGDWENGDHFFRKAMEDWKQWEHFRACFADHAPMEDIDAGFASTQVYCQEQEMEAFAAACCALARQVEAVGEAHELVWWNLF